MCNACNNVCCGSDQLEGCGCDNCDEEACWSTCDACELPIDACDCDEADDGDFIVGPDYPPSHERPEFLGWPA